MLRFIVLSAAVLAMASANTQPFRPANQDARNMQHRSSGFGVQGNFGAGDAFGVNAGVQVGNPLQSNFLMPVIIGLGILSFVQIAITVISPFLTKKAVAPATATAATAATTTPAPAVTARNQRAILDVAGNVYEALQKLQEQYSEEPFFAEE